jgi:hypothetical protein
MGRCPALTFTVKGKTITTTADTHFLGGTCDSIRNGFTVEVEGEAAGSAITAATVKIEDSTDDEDTEISGMVSGLSGTCPDRSFTVGSKTVTVSSATQYRSGSSCTALSDGDVVEVEGHASGSMITASTLKIEHQEGGADTTLQGVVSAVLTGCPALSFTLQGKTVTATTGTEFRKGVCGDVAAGKSLEAEGVLTGDTLAASKISFSTEKD